MCLNKGMPMDASLRQWNPIYYKELG